MGKRYWDVFIGFCVFVFSIVNYFFVPYQEWAGRHGPSFMRPEYFPLVILLGMAIFGAGICINALLAKNYESDVQKISLKVVVVMVIAVIYSITFDILKFYVLTPIIVFVMAIYFGEKGVGFLIGLPIILTVVIYYSARHGLKIVLP